MDSGVDQEAVVVGGKAGVSGGFEEAEGEVFGRAEAFVGDLAQQAALVDQWSEDAGNLQQEIVDLDAGLVVGVCVFEVVSAVFLDVEAFVFNLPSQASSLVARFDDVFFGDGKRREPLEAGGLGLRRSVGVPGVWLTGFLALDDMHGVMAPLGIDVVDVVDPSEGLCDGGVLAGAMKEGPCGAAQFVELLVDAGQLVVLKRDEEFPPILAVQGEDVPWS